MTPASLFKRLRHGLSWRYQHYMDTAPLYVALALTKLRWLRKPAQLPHKLPAPLIISLTSYRPRFATLLPTLQCLLLQTIKPDAVILWIDEKDRDFILAPIKALESCGLTITATASDIGPYKKIIPALTQFPDAFIVTADDDLYYRPTWLAMLLDNWNGDTHQIVCHRAHEIRFDAADLPLPYSEWGYETKGPRDSASIFPTGVGGIFYPPRCMDAQVTDEATFMRVCQKADDIWLFWMARRAACTYRKTAFNDKMKNWPQSQKVNLHVQNVAAGGNDSKIKAMIAEFGWPKTL